MICVVGVTGSMGCGKSSVTRLLGEMGALTLDADQLAREILAPGTPGLQAVVSRFGGALLTETDPPRLNRSLLAETVFADPAARRDLEAIVHPGVYRSMGATLARWERDQPAGAPLIAALEIPLLLETGAGSLCDLIVVVACKERQWERLQSRTGMSASIQEKVMEQQLPEAEKCRLAHWVIDNSHDWASTVSQAERLWLDLRSRCLDGRSPRAWPTRWDIFSSQ
ncbi:MAG: dephospho-CoA kinase [Magnetococcales bacterium]|nr:dephospho-CoA kinase [Magnetococcales bacterium]